MTIPPHLRPYVMPGALALSLIVNFFVIREFIQHGQGVADLDRAIHGCIDDLEHSVRLTAVSLHGHFWEPTLELLSQANLPLDSAGLEPVVVADREAGHIVVDNAFTIVFDEQGKVTSVQHDNPNFSR